VIDELYEAELSLGAFPVPLWAEAIPTPPKIAPAAMPAATHFVRLGLRGLFSFIALSSFSAPEEIPSDYATGCVAGAERLL
jgi:hypothetical protein